MGRKSNIFFICSGLVQPKNKYLGNSYVADWTVSFDLKFRSPTYLLIYIRLFLPISLVHSFPLFLPISLVHVLSLCTKMAGGVAVSTHPGKDYPGKMTVHVMVACLIAAFGGLIFGYDIGISGGVTSMTPFLKKFFPSVYQKEIGDKSTNQYCKFDSAVLTLFTSSLYIAALISSCFASIVTKKLGRKATMFWGGLVFLVGAVLNGLANNIAMLIIGRLCLGVGVGFANQSVPVYLSEIAPSKYRGALNVTFQLMITIGNFGANIVNYFTDKIENGSGWRWSLGGAAVPALMITVGSLFLTDTPNSLLDRNKPQEAKSKLRKIRGIDNVDEEYNDIVAAGEASRKVDAPWSKLFFDRKYRPSVVMAFMIPMFQQITGINVIMFYAPVLFKTLGFGGTAALMSACITGGVNALATIVSIVSVDRLGRRALLLEGGTQMLIFQFIVGGLIANKFGVSGNVTNVETGYAMGVVACICIYVAGFAWSWGPLGWLVPSEIFPLEVRPAAQSITVSVNMFFTFIIAEVFLKLLCVLKFGLFFLFGGCTVMMTFFVYFLLPETKGVPIEEMSARVWKKHWYWGKFIPDENAYELKENKGYPQV